MDALARLAVRLTTKGPSTPLRGRSTAPSKASGAVVRLAKVFRIYVPPHIRRLNDGGLTQVEGYWREGGFAALDPQERLAVKKRYAEVRDPTLPEPKGFAETISRVEEAVNRSAHAREALKRVPTEANVGADEVPNWEGLSSRQPSTGAPGSVVLHDTPGGEAFFQRIANAYDDQGRLASTAQADIAKVARGNLQPGEVKALYVATRPDARRQGHATKAYDALRESGLNIVPAVGQSGVSAEGAPFTRSYLKGLAYGREEPKAGEWIRYHETEGDFSEFSPQHQGAGNWGKGIYTRGSLEQASGMYGHTMMKLKVTLRRPLAIDQPIPRDMLDEVDKAMRESNDPEYLGIPGETLNEKYSWWQSENQKGFSPADPGPYDIYTEKTPWKQHGFFMRMSTPREADLLEDSEGFDNMRARFEKIGVDGLISHGKPLVVWDTKAVQILDRIPIEMRPGFTPRRPPGTANLTAIERLSHKVELARVYVQPHISHTDDGKPFKVAGYWRQGSPHVNPIAVEEATRVQTPEEIATYGQHDRPYLIGVQAKKAKQTPEQFGKAENAHITNLLKRGKIVVHIDGEGLKGVLKSGRIKNRHETGKTSGGDWSSKERKAVEKRLFTDNPIYGVVKENTDDLGPTQMLGNYGLYGVVLKPKVKNRTTFTFGDSLDQTGSEEHYTGNPDVAPVPRPMVGADPERYLAFPYGDTRQGIGNQAKKAQALKSVDRPPGLGYTEAQIHEEVPVSDIGEVIAWIVDGYNDSEEDEQVREDIRKQLLAHGVKMRTVYTKLQKPPGGSEYYSNDEQPFGLTHVVVPPYLRIEDGKVIQVAGYEYDRAGPGPLSSLRTKTVTGPAPTSLLSKTDVQDQRKHATQPIHLDEAKFEAAAIAVGIDISKVKSIKLRFRDLGQHQGVTQNLGGGNFRVVVGIAPKAKYEERHLYVVNNSLVHELRHVTQMQKGNKTEYLASKEDFAAANLQHAKAGGYVKMEAEAQMFGRLAWHGDPAKKPLGPLAKDKEHMGKNLWAIAFDAEQSARGDVGYATWEGDEPLNANFRTFTSPAKDRRNYVARITGGDMTTEKGVQREFLEDAWEKTGEQELSDLQGGKRVLEKWQPRIPAQDGVYEVQFYHQDPNKQKSKDTKSRHHIIVKGGIARVEIDPDELQAAMSADMPAKVFLAGGRVSAVEHLAALARVKVDPYLRKEGGKIVHVEGYLRDQSFAETNDAILGAVKRTKERAAAKTEKPKPKPKPLVDKARMKKAEAMLPESAGITNVYELEDDEEIEAVEWYISTYALNRALREENVKSLAEFEDNLAALDRAIASSTTTKDVLMYRGTEVPEELRGMDPADMIGKTFTEKAYTSTTSDEEQVGNYMFKEGQNVEGNIAGPPAKQTVLIPPGIHSVGDDMEEITEGVLERGLSFKVLDAKYRDDPDVGKVVDMTVEAIPRGKKK